MSFCIICSLRRLHPSRRINSEDEALFPSDLTRELEDLHKVSLNSLMALLAALAVSGSKSVLPVVLALLIYTISLRFTINTCFLQNYPTLLRFLHAVPLLGTFCVASIELVLDMRSPTLAAVVLLLSVLPFIAIIIHHSGRQCEGIPLPIRMHGAPAMSGSSDPTAVSD
ncbi:hypothetical protein HD554DRAFT_1077130 [Boletus coccyginus]|nr:hypothetical protein HD554DRAFT_1077130 [Boletus coccyginus]